MNTFLTIVGGAALGFLTCFSITYIIYTNLQVWDNKKSLLSVDQSLDQIRDAARDMYWKQDKENRVLRDQIESLRETVGLLKRERNSDPTQGTRKD